MAVTTTPQELIEAAYAKSTKNAPGAIATESTELLELVIRTIRKFYVIAARVNPLYFADTSQVAAPGTGNPWARPEGAESIFRIENAGTEVVVVPHDDRAAESGKPSVYRMGKNYYEAGNASDPDPASDALDFWFSKRPADPANLTATIEASWEEQFNELLVTEIAIYLANKDERPGEIPMLVKDRDEWLRMFILFLEHETANERRRFGHLRRFNTQSLVPISDILAGGSTVDLTKGSD
jgi:hypothetical protein